MPTILTKKSDTPGAVPSTSDLTNLAGGAELAVNTAEKRLFTMNSSSAIIEVGTNPSSLTCADASFTVARVGSLTISSLSLTNATVTSATITNLTSSSATITNLINSGGTANGVLYLNGSKVATSGSALTFDGSIFSVNNTGAIPSTTIPAQFNNGGAFLRVSVTSAASGSSLADIYSHSGGGGNVSSSAMSFSVRNAGTTTETMRITSAGNLGIGTTSPDNKLEVATGDNGGINIEQTGASQTGYLNFRDSDGGLQGRISYDHSNDSLRFATAGSESLRVTSTGSVGIGTSSPATKLQVATASGDSKIRISSGSNTLTFGWDDPQGFIYAAVGGYQAWQIGGTTRMLLDTSGNLGLGVTPSAWASGRRVLQIGASAYGALQDNGAGSFTVSRNYFTDGTSKYIANGTASIFSLENDGSFAWFTAASGTAGNAISFTQAMTLDADGDLGVGTTSPTTVSNYRAITVNGTNGGILDLKYGDTLGGRVVASSGGLSLETGGTTPMAFYTSNTERARITSGGDLLVGTTSGSGAKLDVNGAINMTAVSSIVPSYGMRLETGVGTQINSSLATTFYNNSAERARITSGGRFYVNTQSAVVSSDEICGMVGTAGLSVRSLGGTSSFSASFWNAAESGDNILVDFYTESGGTKRGSITYNRGAGQVAYNVTSDARLKDNIANSVDAGSKVDALQVRQFDWKETGNHVDYGFVAQELDAVVPHAVSKPEDTNAMWSVDYSKLVPMLVKEIQSLRARVAQLESK